jgi:hypothetical protein
MSSRPFPLAHALATAPKPSSATLEALQTRATGGEGSGSCADVPAVLESNKGGVVMITRFKSQFRFLLMLGLLLLLPFSARAQELQQNFQTYVGLDVALASTNEFLTLQDMNSTGTYTVPSGNILILTDFILSPLSPPASGTQFHVNISTSGAVMALDSSGGDPSSFHVSLRSGMRVLPGQQVTVSMGYGEAAALYVFGRLQAIYNPTLPSP